MTDFTHLDDVNQFTLFYSYDHIEHACIGLWNPSTGMNIRHFYQEKWRQPLADACRTSMEDLAGTTSMGEAGSVAWSSFARHVDQIYSAARKGQDINVQIELRRVVHEMYNQLVDDEYFREQFRRSPEPHECDTPAWFASIFEESYLHAGLMTVYRGREVPLHDHPGSYGLVLVLSGMARFQYADVIARDDSNNLVKLKMNISRERLPGQVCWFFEDERNLHGIQATTATAQLLVMHFPPVARDRQAFYFPVDDEKEQQRDIVTAQRVRIQREI